MYRPKILVADDEPEWRELIARWLREPGYRLFFAGKGKDLLPLAERHHPDCILLDFHMGVETAAELCKGVRSHPSLQTVPIVILTSHPEVEIRAYSACQADHFVEKGACPAKLLAVLEAVFRRIAWERGAIKKGDLDLEPKSHGVYREGRLVARLSPEQFQFLQLLVRRSPEFVASAEIYKHVLREHRPAEDTDAIRSLAHRARQSLDKTLARRIRSAKHLGWAYVEPAGSSTRP